MSSIPVFEPTQYIWGPVLVGPIPTCCSNEDSSPEANLDTLDSEGSDTRPKMRPVDQQRVAQGPKIRQRKGKAPIDYGDLDFSQLNDPSTTTLRPHPPIPEMSFESYDECVSYYQAFAEEHHLYFIQSRWRKGATGLKYRCDIRCSAAGKPKDRPLGARKRQTTGSGRLGCPFAFDIVAEDYRDPPSGRWRIVHQTGVKHKLKSLLHTHPPFVDNAEYPMYRRKFANDEGVQHHILDVYPKCGGAKEVLASLRKKFPGINLTPQDIRNVWYKHAQ